MSWFTTASDLEARVSAAVTMAGLTRQLDLQRANALESGVGSASDSNAREGIKTAIVDAARAGQCALKIDLVKTWWSTRLYLLAALAERLTQVRRILIVDTASVDADTTTARAAAATTGGGTAPTMTTAATANSSAAPGAIRRTDIYGLGLLRRPPEVCGAGHFSKLVAQASGGIRRSARRSRRVAARHHG